MLFLLFVTKLSSFWIALSAGGADAQCFAFVHVENSHPETLRNALPREANISSLYTSPHVPCEFSFLCCSWPFSDSKLLLQAQDLESALTVTEKLFCMAESIFFAWSILLSCFPFISIIRVPLHYFFFSSVSSFNHSLIPNQLYFQTLSLHLKFAYFQNSSTSILSSLIGFVMLKQPSVVIARLYGMMAENPPWRQNTGSTHSTVLVSMVLLQGGDAWWDFEMLIAGWHFA